MGEKNRTEGQRETERVKCSTCNYKTDSRRRERHTERQRKRQRDKRREWETEREGEREKERGE